MGLGEVSLEFRLRVSTAGRRGGAKKTECGLTAGRVGMFSERICSHFSGSEGKEYAGGNDCRTLYTGGLVLIT